ncbi:hypothetical protein EYZ11_011579 [Aspergillus tanneri]|nr:hypothetical protein EYZ11_011579 [Aspergillus tanneri]
MYSWSSWHTVVPLVVGAVGIVVFGFYEKHVAVEPIVRLSIFKTCTAIISYLGTILHGMILWCVLYYMPLYFEGVKGYTPILSGLSCLPMTFTVAPAAGVVGIIIAVTGRYRHTIWVGWTFSTLGLGLLYLLDVHTPIALWVCVMIVGGTGLGILFPSMAFAIQGSAVDADVAYAIGMFSFFRAFGQTVGVAVGGVIFQNRMRIELQKYPKFAPLAAGYVQDATALVEIIKSMSDSVEKSNLKQAYADGLKPVWATCCGLAGIGLVLSSWTKAYSLDRGLVTEQAFQHRKLRAGRSRHEIAQLA